MNSIKPRELVASLFQDAAVVCSDSVARLWWAFPRGGVTEYCTYIAPSTFQGVFPCTVTQYIDWKSIAVRSALHSRACEWMKSQRGEKERANVVGLSIKGKLRRRI